MSLRDPRGTTRRKQGGGLGWLGALMGAGNITGGEFVPPETMEVAGPTPTGEPLRPQVIGKPGFTRPQVQHPTLDAIFNRGRGGMLATQMDARQQELLFQAQMQEQIAQLANSGAIDTEMLRGHNRLQEVKEGGNQSIRTGDAGMLNKLGLLSSAGGEYGNRIQPKLLTQQENEANTIAGFTGTPEGQELARKNYSGRMLQPVADNIAKTSFQVQPNNLLYQALGPDGQQPGNPYITPGLQSTETLEMVGGWVDPKTGMRIGGQPKSTTSYNQRPAYSPIEIAKREDEIRKRIAQAELTNKPSNNHPIYLNTDAPAVGNPNTPLPQLQPKPAESPNTALIPQAGRMAMQAGQMGIEQLLQGLSLPPNSPAAQMIRLLFNSNYKKQPSANILPAE